VPFPGEIEDLKAADDDVFEPGPDPRSPLATPTVRRFAVADLATGELLGRVNWFAVSHGPTFSCHAWEIGIGLLPTARGRGVGTLAQRLLVEYLFATTELDRVEASTDVDNVVEQRALERIGMRREGVLRGAQMRGGRRRDMVVYGILRADL